MARGEKNSNHPGDCDSHVHTYARPHTHACTYAAHVNLLPHIQSAVIYSYRTGLQKALEAGGTRSGLLKPDWAYLTVTISSSGVWWRSTTHSPVQTFGSNISQISPLNISSFSLLFCWFHVCQGNSFQPCTEEIDSRANYHHPQRKTGPKEKERRRGEWKERRWKHSWHFS